MVAVIFYYFKMTERRNEMNIHYWLEATNNNPSMTPMSEIVNSFDNVLTFFKEFYEFQILSDC